MEFLDPKKERQNRIILFVGYVLIAIAIGIATLLLVFYASGFTVDKNGQVIQNGLMFVSSHPSGANIYINNELYKTKTNTRMTLPAGNYTLKVAQTGYRDWQRPITIAGGDVQHFDYPFLFPVALQTRDIATLQAAPSLVTQSPDHRWMLVLPVATQPVFTMYDLKDPKNVIPTEQTIPAAAFTPGTGAQSWTAVEWSTDNRHVLLSHTYTTAENAPGQEYVAFDRQDPAASVNVTKTLSLAAGDTLSLWDKKYDQYYVFNAAAQTLRTATLNGDGTPRSYDHILAFKPYAGDMLVYVTTQAPSGKVLPAGKVSLVLQQGEKTYTLVSLPANAPQYSLDIARYSGDWYVVAGASNDKGVYVYKNPQSSAATSGSAALVWRLLRLNDPRHVSFSATAQYILAESGQQFVVYDAENVETYRYTARQPLDQPQAYASWMDGNRLTYVSGGKLVVFDYDYRNEQTLEVAVASYSPAFDPSYHAVYTMAPGTDPAQSLLTQTPLVTKL